jgi:hypothetical protein
MGRRRAWCWLGLLLVACGSEKTTPATDVVVSIDTDLAVGDTLTRVKVELRDATTSALAQSHSFDLDGTTALPLSFGVKKRKADSFLLIVSGIGPKAGGGSATLVQQRVVAHFESGKTVLLRVFLGQVCLHQTCSSDQTCYAETQDGTQAGHCGDIPVAQHLPTVKPGTEPGGDQADASGPDMGSPGDDSDAGATDEDAGTGADADAGSEPVGHDSGTSTSPFVGTWTSVTGAEELDCGSTIDNDLTGAQLNITQKSASAFQIALSDDCVLAAELYKDQLVVTDKHCTLVPSADESDLYEFSNMTISFDGDDSTATLTWLADVTATIDSSQQVACTSTASSSLTRMQ